MYSEELEMLIDAALADGELTEKEKKVLYKKAKEEGLDLDEFEMILEARLVKQNKSIATKTDKFGDVKKCPNCGSVIQTHIGVCPECGYAFEGLEANSSAKHLAELIQKTIDNTHNEERRKQEIKTIILSFPIPNSKADLMEFIISLKPKTKGDSYDNPYKDAYLSKYIECIDKAKYMFPNDEDFARVLKKYKLNWWKRIPSSTREIILCFLLAIVLLGGMYFLITMENPF